MITKARVCSGGGGQHVFRLERHTSDTSVENRAPTLSFRFAQSIAGPAGEPHNDMADATEKLRPSRPLPSGWSDSSDDVGCDFDPNLDPCNSEAATV